MDQFLRARDLGRISPVANVYRNFFSCHVASAKERPIDKPRNLAKSLTVKWRTATFTPYVAAIRLAPHQIFLLACRREGHGESVRFGLTTLDEAVRRWSSDRVP